MNEEQFKKDFPSIVNFYGGLIPNWSDETKICVLDVKRHCLDKEKAREVIDKLISKSNDIHSFVDDEKIKEVEFFGDDKREYRERGYMRWAFEDGCNEALIRLKKDLGLDDKLFGMEIKVDKNLKENEFRLEFPLPVKGEIINTGSWKEKKVRMKKLKGMTTDEKLSVWADHMCGIKINPELKKRGVQLAIHKFKKKN